MTAGPLGGKRSEAPFRRVSASWFPGRRGANEEGALRRRKVKMLGRWAADAEVSGRCSQALLAARGCTAGHWRSWLPVGSQSPPFESRPSHLPPSQHQDINAWQHGRHWLHSWRASWLTALASALCAASFLKGDLGSRECPLPAPAGLGSRPEAIRCPAALFLPPKSPHTHRATPPSVRVPWTVDTCVRTTCSPRGSCNSVRPLSDGLSSHRTHFPQRPASCPSGPALARPANGTTGSAPFKVQTRGLGQCAVQFQSEEISRAEPSTRHDDVPGRHPKTAEARTREGHRDTAPQTILSPAHLRPRRLRRTARQARGQEPSRPSNTCLLLCASGRYCYW